jgi:hypothetical protein
MLNANGAIFQWRNFYKYQPFTDVSGVRKFLQILLQIVWCDDGQPRKFPPRQEKTLPSGLRPQLIRLGPF